MLTCAFVACCLNSLLHLSELAKIAKQGRADGGKLMLLGASFIAVNTVGAIGVARALGWF